MVSGASPGGTSPCTVSVGTRSRLQRSGVSCSKLREASWFKGTVRPDGSGIC